LKEWTKEDSGHVESKNAPDQDHGKTQYYYGMIGNRLAVHGIET
jgi:hypothetical protein